jgi:hypothetical protein
MSMNVFQLFAAVLAQLFVFGCFPNTAFHICGHTDNTTAMAWQSGATT